MMKASSLQRHHSLSASSYSASSVEGSIQTELSSCGLPSFSSDSLFQQLNPSSSEDISVAAHRPRSDHLQVTDPPMTSPKDPLVIKLTAFEARGWISRSEYMQCRKMITHVDQRRRVQRLLADVAARQRAPASRPAAPSSILYKGSNLSVSSRNLRVSWEDQSLTSDTSNKENGTARREPATVSAAATLTTNPAFNMSAKQSAYPPPMQTSFVSITNVKETNELLMLEPSALWKGNAPLSEQELQVLFVETCFFARLGFVQPPCCLKCTYRQTVKNERASTQKPCRQWVVWRKNAEEALHPNKLVGNIVLIQCHAANSLLEGNHVDGCCWDSSRKQLVKEHFSI